MRHGNYFDVIGFRHLHTELSCQLSSGKRQSISMIYVVPEEAF
jgi:hypothetical protein